CTAVAFVAFLELIKEAGPIRASVITYVHPAIAVAAGTVFLDEALTVTVLVAFALILTGSVLATAASPKPPASQPTPPEAAPPPSATPAQPSPPRPTAPGPRPRPVPWSTRQRSRADGRVDSLTGLPEERPGSTGQGGGERPPGVTRGTVPQKADRRGPRSPVRVKRWCKRPPAPGVTQ